MEKIIINPIGAYYAYLDEETDTWITKDLIDSTMPISWYLPMPVEIETGVTTRRILELFERYSDQLNFVYAKALKTLTIEDIFKVIEEHRETDAEPSAVMSTCLVWIGEVHPGREDDYLVINSALVGLDTDGEIPEEDDSETVYQLTNFDFVEWCQLPIYMDDYLDFMEVGRIDDEIFGGIYPWKLHDVFECILSEITLNLFVSGLATHPDIVVSTNAPKMTSSQLFDYMDGLDDLDGM